MDVGDGPFRSMSSMVAIRKGLIPVVVLHGGPAAGAARRCGAILTRKNNHVILIESAGCGRSKAVCVSDEQHHMGSGR